MYHDIVSDCDSSSGFQNESAFQYKVNKQSFEECVKSCPPDKVLFTFDDGGYSFLSDAAPILEKYGHFGVFFIATDYIGTPGFLGAEQIKELDARGHIIGSHSCSHPHNMREQKNEAIEKEWSTSVKVLENILGHKVEYASIPNGYSSSIVIEKAKTAGIKYLYTSTPISRIKEINGMKIIGRYVVHDKMSNDEIISIIGSKLTRQKKYLRWLAIEFLKFILGSHYDSVKAKLISKTNK